MAPDDIVLAMLLNFVALFAAGALASAITLAYELTTRRIF